MTSLNVGLMGVGRLGRMYGQYLARRVPGVALAASLHKHSQGSRDGCGRGKAIFCEKPISLTLGDARQMMQAVEAADVFFQMAFQRGFDTAYLAAKRKLESGPSANPSCLRPSHPILTRRRWSSAIPRSVAG